MYQPILLRKFNLKRFRVEIDRKKRAVLMSMVLEQYEKNQFQKITIFFQNHFSSNMFFGNTFHLQNMYCTYSTCTVHTVHVLYIQYLYCTYNTCTVHTQYMYCMYNTCTVHTVHVLYVQYTSCIYNTCTVYTVQTQIQQKSKMNKLYKKKTKLIIFLT